MTLLKIANTGRVTLRCRCVALYTTGDCNTTGDYDSRRAAEHRRQLFVGPCSQVHMAKS